MSFTRLFGGSVCDPTSYAYNSDACGYGTLALWVIILLIACFVFLVIAVAFEIISRWIFFKKCGEAGWKAIIPVYNDLTYLKVAGMNWWWIFILYASSILSLINSEISSFVTEFDSIGLSFISLFFSLIVLAASVFTLLTRIGMAINITKKFHKNGGYAVLIILFEPIMLLILGLSKNEKYDNSVEVPINGIFGPRQAASTNAGFCSNCGTKVTGDFCSNCGKKVK